MTPQHADTQRTRRTQPNHRVQFRADFYKNFKLCHNLNGGGQTPPPNLHGLTEPVAPSKTLADDQVRKVPARNGQNDGTQPEHGRVHVTRQVHAGVRQRNLSVCPDSGRKRCDGCDGRTRALLHAATTANGNRFERFEHCPLVPFLVGRLLTHKQNR